MAQERRLSNTITDKRSVGEGVYLAKIISHLDPSFMGSLEVTLLRNQGNIIGDETQTYVVKCASPFFGYTGFEFMGNNTTANGASTNEAYNDTQKSYGMWFVPPDVGITVLVTFVDGDPAQGFWIGCVPSNFSNHMVPAIAGSSEVDIDDADKRRFGWPGKNKMPLPVAEINRRANKTTQQVDPEKIKKPLHPIAEYFLLQGLIEDDVRGTTTSSARRDVPSMVFGISTPGPLDRRNGAKRSKIGVNENQTRTAVPVSRLGGTQLVMDDGDDRYFRTSPAGQGPVEYADTLAGDKGFTDIPYNEYFRVRTRTGHQLLMHNSEDLIYIGNSRGTSWIEMTSNGKIDIYAKDSVSLHTENDLNIRADRDINMEAGRNINLRSEQGRIHADVATDFELVIGNNGKITTQGSFDSFAGVNTKITSGQDFDLLSGGNTKISSNSNFDLLTAGNNFFTARGNQDHRTFGRHTTTADLPSKIRAEVATGAETASVTSALNLHLNPKTNGTNEWRINKYQDGLLASIMKRVPMHEPWALHENQAPQFLNPKDTDRDGS